MYNNNVAKRNSYLIKEKIMRINRKDLIEKYGDKLTFFQVDYINKSDKEYFNYDEKGNNIDCGTCFGITNCVLCDFCGNCNNLSHSVMCFECENGYGGEKLSNEKNFYY